LVSRGCEGGPMTDDLERRGADLKRLARERGFDPETILRGIPDDPPAQVFALAIRLGLDPLGALQNDLPLEQLEQASRARREAAEMLERQGNEMVTPPPGEGG
jgi:hypothetical protein